jgi:hypothetical protein
MFGAWQAGAWQSLVQRFQPDLVVGASVGSLNGYATAAGWSAADLCHWWLRPGLASSRSLRSGSHSGDRFLSVFQSPSDGDRNLRSSQVHFIRLECRSDQRRILRVQRRDAHDSRDCQARGAADPQHETIRWQRNDG